MNIYFFQCQEDFNGNMYLPYSSGILWMYVSQNNTIKNNYNLVDIFFEKLSPSEYIKKIEKTPPDIALFSNYGWNTEYHLSVARAIKEKWNNCKIIIGGPNSQQDSEYIEKNNFIDIATWGEGEETLKELFLELLKETPNLSTINGLAYFEDGFFFKNSIRQRKDDIDDIPSPYLEGLFDSFFERYDYNFMPIWETNRGCPYHCTFCDMGRDYYNKLKRYSTDRLLKEIDWFSEKKIEYVEVADANFGILERDLELVKYIKKKNKETNFPQKISATWAKMNPDRIFEMSKILDSINRGGVTLALQTLNEVALDNVKRKNIANTKLESITERYIKHKMPTYHDFILGLPGETLQTWKESLLKIIDINPEGWIFGHPLEAYKNTEFSDEEYIKKHGLKFAITPQISFFARRNTKIPIEYGNYVIEHNTMSKEDYIEGFLFKWFLITVHSFGWFKRIANDISYLKKVDKSTVYLKLFDWIKKNKETVIYKEYNITKEMILDTITNGKIWGRQMFGDDDIYWDYETASSIVFEKNRKKLYYEFELFVKQTYPEIKEGSTIVKINDLEVISFGRKYPIVFNNIKFENKEFSSFKDFCINIYWYGRRRKAWRGKIKKNNKYLNNEGNKNIIKYIFDVNLK